jgi:hypothetical protein
VRRLTSPFIPKGFIEVLIRKYAMDIFRVVNELGEVVKAGFSIKSEAKAFRDSLYTAEKYTAEERKKILNTGIPPLPFRVTIGEDHWKWSAANKGAR